jgi:AcrR family transcriptional regulator
MNERKPAGARRRGAGRRPSVAPKTRSAAAGSSSPGRPRDQERQSATIAATAELLREVGYSRLSIDAVAKRAGVTRQLIYRWWEHKARLVMEALFRWNEDQAAPDTGSFDGDLRSLVAEVVKRYARPEMALGLPGLQADLLAQPSLLRDVDREFVAPVAARWREVFERAQLRGELPPSAHARAAMDVAVGAVTVLLQERTLGRRAIVGYVTGVLLDGIGGATRSARPSASRRGNARRSAGEARGPR